MPRFQQFIQNPHWVSQKPIDLNRSQNSEKFSQKSPFCIHKISTMINITFSINCNIFRKIIIHRSTLKIPTNTCKVNERLLKWTKAEVSCTSKTLFDWHRSYQRFSFLPLQAFENLLNNRSHILRRWEEKFSTTNIGTINLWNLILI